MKTTIRLRRDTAARWTAANPVLGLGEPGLETDTLKLKFGDGVTAWNALAYLPTGGGVGPAGAAGAPGPAVLGNQGRPGRDSWVPGPQGPAGAAGAAGPAGVVGPTGSQGSPGLDGRTGKDSWVPGPQGLQGSQGIQGPQGIPGVSGSAGQAGPQGLDGKQGRDSWIPGPQGPAGPAGSGSGGGITEVEIDFGTQPLCEVTLVVVDGTVTAASKIVATQSGKAATGREADEGEMDRFTIVASPEAGQIRMWFRGDDNRAVLQGKWKINYQVAA